jgi:hypothetical protein
VREAEQIAEHWAISNLEQAVNTLHQAAQSAISSLFCFEI